MKSILGRTTTKFYAYALFNNLILIYPLYAIMFADKGLSPAQISSLFVVWSLTAFLLEVPSGSIADKYKRKNVLLAGVILRIMGFMFWWLYPTYWGFFIGFVTWGIKAALSSGTTEALVYDEMRRENTLPSYAKVMGRISVSGLSGVVLAGFGASLLAHSGYGPILILSIVASLVSAVALLLLPNAKAVDSTHETKYFDYLKEGLSLAFKTPAILYLIILMGIILGLGSIDEYYGLFLKEKGLSNTLLSFWLGIVYVFGALGSLYAHKLENRKLSTSLTLGGYAAILLLATVAPKQFTPLLLGLYVLFCYGSQVVFNARLQKELNDKTRATTTSVGGLVAQVFAMLAFGTMTLGTNLSGYAYAYRLIALGIIVCGVVLAAFAAGLKHRRSSIR